MLEALGAPSRRSPTTTRSTSWCSPQTARPSAPATTSRSSTRAAATTTGRGYFKHIFSCAAHDAADRHAAEACHRAVQGIGHRRRLPVGRELRSRRRLRAAQASPPPASTSASSARRRWWRSPARPRKQAMEMLLTGEMISAEHAKQRPRQPRGAGGAARRGGRARPPDRRQVAPRSQDRQGGFLSPG